MAKQHYTRYLTQDDVLLAIKEWKTKQKGDLVMSIKAIPAVSVARSRRLSMVIVERGEEFCPHCRKGLRFYDVVNGAPKYAYCMWCGGAIERPKGNKNGHFNYNLIKDKPEIENPYPIRPTLGQIRFARAISQKLGIPLPEEATSKGYWQFINDHQKEYYRVIKQRKENKLNEQLSDFRGEERRDDTSRDFQRAVSETVQEEERPYRLPGMRDG